MSGRRNNTRSSGSFRTRQLFGRALDLARYWNATAAEWTAQYPCDRCVQSLRERFTRAMEVESSPETVFRWLCQLEVAPYGYDRIDDPVRRGPRSLTPEADRLELGQEFFVSWPVEFSSRTAT
jgi:hypothetical protein